MINDVDMVESLQAIAMEEALPAGVSNAEALAPEEVSLIMQLGVFLHVPLIIPCYLLLSYK